MDWTNVEFLKVLAEILKAGAELIKALAWPSVAVIALLLFRRVLAEEIIPYVKSLKGAGFELIFERGTAQVKKLIEVEKSPETLKDSQTEPATREQEEEQEVSAKLLREEEVEAEFVRKLVIEPRFAVNEAWARLQASGLRALKFFEKEFKGEDVLRPFEELLLEKGHLTGAQFQAISKLRQLQADLMYVNPSRTPKTAFKNYVDSALKLARELEYLVYRGKAR